LRLALIAGFTPSLNNRKLRRHIYEVLSAELKRSHMIIFDSFYNQNFSSIYSREKNKQNQIGSLQENY